MNRPILTVPVQKVEGDSSAPFQDLLAVEEPLEIRLNGETLAITMRTPGHDADLAQLSIIPPGTPIDIVS